MHRYQCLARREKPDVVCNDPFIYPAANALIDGVGGGRRRNVRSACGEMRASRRVRAQVGGDQIHRPQDGQNEPGFVGAEIDSGERKRVTVR